jgi:SAM-dependent methyltransferase
LDQPQIRFDDGAAYEDFMGKWSQLVGDVFLQWLAPAAGWRWIDVGCGNGAFTAKLVERCAPLSVHGVDPSPAQLAFARERFAPGAAEFALGDAMQLPCADRAFDAAVMALVLFFVPEPAQGVAEMARVVRPGGSVSAYAWDILGGGFPIVAMHEEMAALGTQPMWPPSVAAAHLDAMRTLWEGAGLIEVETRPITVQRSFDDFESFWHIAQAGPGIGPRVATMAAADVALLRDRVRARLPADAQGRITCSARANAVKGRVPA